MSNFVFFCEGGNERTLIKSLNTDIYGPNSTRWTVAKISRILEQDGQEWFTPKRILDYYLDTIGKFNEEWNYIYDDKRRPRNNDSLNDVRTRINEGAQVCLLIDTDVFFKQRGPYANLNYEQNNVLINDNAQVKKLFCDTFRKAEGYNYRFLEQELTFEDFIVLFFVGEDFYDEGDDVWVFDGNYKSWFIRRFGVDRYQTNARLGMYAGNTALSNSIVNGGILKTALANLLGNCYEDFKMLCDINENQTLEAWIESQEKDRLSRIISNWVIMHMRNVNLKNRLEIARNRIKKHMQIHWPFRFGLIDFLEQEITQ